MGKPQPWALGAMGLMLGLAVALGLWQALAGPNEGSVPVPVPGMGEAREPDRPGQADEDLGEERGEERGAIRGRESNPGLVAAETPPAGEEQAGSSASAFRVVGRVVSGAGEGVAGAHVSFLAEHDEEPFAMAEGLSDDQGRFLVPMESLSSLLDAPVEAEISLQMRALGGPLGSAKGTLQLVDREGSKLSLEVVLGGARSSVRGRIVDASGAPLREADVRIRCSDGDYQWQETDAWGRFLIEGLAVEAGAKVTASHPAAGYIQVQVAASSSHLDLGDLALEARGWLAGRIVDPSGHGIQGLECEALSGVRNEIFGHRVVTGPEGRFRFANLRPGEPYRIEFDGASHGDKSWIPSADGIELESSRYAALVRFEDPRGRHLFVERREARRIEGEQYRLRLRERTGGTYFLSTSGPYRVRVSGRADRGSQSLVGGRSFRLDEASGEVVVVLQAEEDVPVEITAIDPSGVPIADWSGLLTRADTGDRMLEFESSEQIDLPSGAYDLRVTPDPSGYVFPFETSFHVDPGGVARVTCEALRFGGHYSIEIVDPPPGAWVYLSVDRVQPDGTRTKVHEHNPYEGDRRVSPYVLPPGSFEARVTTSENEDRPVVKPFELRPEATTSIRIPL